MDSRLLEYLLRVAELGSINKAAPELHLSQPALSRHIARLEHEMGTELFTRTQGGVRLTDAGRLLCERARPLLRQLSTVKEEVRQKASGMLAIGIPPSWQRVFTSRFVGTFVQELPAVALRVSEGVSNRLREQMLEGLLDLAILPFDTSPTDGYRQMQLVREPLVLVGPAKAGLTPDSPMSLTGLDGLGLVIPGRPNVIRRYVEHGLSKRGGVLRVIVEADALSLCLDCALQGVGYTVAPACALVGLATIDSLSWTPVQHAYVTWALFENRARSHSAAVREARRLVLRHVGDAVSSGAWFGAVATNKQSRGEADVLQGPVTPS